MTTGTNAIEGAMETAVLELSGVQWVTEKAVVEAVLGRRPGVVSVDANPVAQTATITYDPARTTVAELAGWIRDCGYHCQGQSVPRHVCDPPDDLGPSEEANRFVELVAEALAR